MSIDPIRVDGLKQFTKALKDADSDLPKAVREAANEAVNIVVSDAKPRVPRESGRARASIRARSTRSAARIAAGGARAPYYGWLDFGGAVGPNRSVRRPFLKTGRYIWRSYDEKSEDVAQTFEEALRKLADRAGLEVT